METIKSGDIITKKSGESFYACGHSATVDRVKGNKVYIKETGLWVDASTVYVVIQNKESKMNQRKWQFHSVHPADIDFVAINNELNKKNPVALVTLEEDAVGYVIIHSTITDKADIVGITPPIEDEMWNSVGSNWWIGPIPVTDYNKFLDWVSTVHRAEWPEHQRCTVVVSLPRIK